MAVSVVSTVKYEGSTGALTATVTLPTVADDDWVVLMTVGAGTASATPTDGNAGTAGPLTQVGTRANVSGHTSTVWKRKLAASESGKTVGVTMPNTNVTMVLAGVVLRGCDTDDCLDVFAKIANGATAANTVVTPTATTVASNDIELSMIAVTASAGNIPTNATVPSPVVEQTTAATSNTTGNHAFGAVGIDVSAYPASGEIGDRTWTIDGQGATSAWTIGIKAAAATGSSGSASGGTSWSGTASGEHIASGSASTVAPLTVDRWLTTSPLYAAHRGGSADWTEETLYAYEQAAAWNPDLALEISVWLSSDGVWVCSHDQSTQRVFGVDYDIPTTPWATLSTLSVDGHPIAQLSDVLDEFGGKRACFIDNKTNANWSTFWDYLDAHGGPEWLIYKGYIGQHGAAGEAASRGYQAWGFAYETDAANLDAWQSSWTLLGLSYDASTTVWDQITGYGKPVLGHICETAAQAQEATSKGADGIMAAGVMEIVPQVAAGGPGITWHGTATGHTPALSDHSGSATGTLTWTGTATGTAPTVPDHAGSASGTITWVGAVTGERSSTGTVTGGLTWTGTATGSHPAARIDITVTAAGTRVRPLVTADASRADGITADPSRIDWHADDSRIQRGP